MILRILVVTAGLTLSAAVCRYTVRDVGFVDLGDPEYECYAFVSDAGSPGVTTACEQIAESVFMDTNVDFAVVDLDTDEGHPARRHLRELKIQRFPTTVLVHPDGRAVELPFEGNFADVGARVLESVASSPLRRRLTESVLRCYCVVLLVAGDDAKQNREAERVVRASFKAIERVFDEMPKEVGTLPELIALSRAEQAGERLLLWALGVDEGGQQPAVIVLTGRVRQFGPALEGDDIDEDSVLGVLAKVGESCECGLDRSWMRGVRVPLRWDAATRKLAVEKLKFDPENPLVKSEISSILAKGPNGQATKNGESSVADLLLGYSETEISNPGPEDLAAIASSDNAAEVEMDAEPAGSELSIWVTLCGLLVASFGIAAFVLVRVRRP